ncbi:A/G-specific adenine glycosylase [Aquirufa sp.]|jgi:A/G-specific adenine glycosylase|uniref:A/G-specific adenine glycosylase n=1 Tax=Aquirufa sp. TaxID=2676249 RepID=UPI0037839F59
MQKSSIHPFSATIMAWYTDHQRELPWRQTKDPYAIWLSEIILQQTRVAQGLPYYERLLTAFPTVRDLAEAPEASLLRLWQGLGYYSRARNLQKAAQLVMRDFNGSFPQTYDDIITLPGVGPYTAAAIASFAFDEAKAVVDGNVFRVLSRVFGVETDIASSAARGVFTELAQSLIPTEDPAGFNQAIMEFGALQCTPSPDCSICPLRISCAAFKEKRVNELPIKSKKTKVKEIEMNYLIIEQNGLLLVRERVGNSIWKGLWEFYLMEDQADWLPYSRKALKSPPVHLLSHRKIKCEAWHVQVPDNFALAIPEGYRWMSPSEFESKGKPVLLLNLITDNLDCPILQDISPTYL